MRLYVERGARLAAIASGMMVSVLVGMPRAVLGFAFTAEIAQRVAFRLTLGALVTVLLACVGLTGAATFGEQQLEATAVATTMGLTVTLVLAAFAVRSATGGFIPWPTVTRVLVALGIAAGVGSMMPVYGRWFTPVGACVVAVTYLVTLAVTRELTRADAHAMRALRE